MVFKTTCVDAGKPLREGAFFFARRALFPPLDKKNTRDKAKGLCISLERVYRGARRAMPLHSKNSGQDSRQQAQNRERFHQGLLCHESVRLKFAQV